MGSDRRSHGLRLSTASARGMLPTSLRPAATTRMTTEEPGDQVSSEVRASQLAAAHYSRSEGLTRLPGGGQSSRADLTCSDASHLCRPLALRLIVLPNGKEKP